MAFQLHRHFSNSSRSPLDEVGWRELPVPGFAGLVTVPAFWSDAAAEIAATRYLRSSVGERSVRALFSRVVSAIAQAGRQQGLLGSDEQARIFSDELMSLLLHQRGSFNSPVYFNVGVFPTYGYAGQSENFVWNERLQRAEALTTAFIHPQSSACFIQSVDDALMSIFELLKNEAKLFKYGSGTGTNFSALRGQGESLDSGGVSTGLISYLEIFDKAAQAIKSGGTTRRAAKMVVLDADHPDILAFINWKRDEERKARVLLANGFSGGFDGEAFRTVSGQNSNNSIRLTDEFMRRVDGGASWALRARKGGRVVQELPAERLLTTLARAAWECADPGVQFHDTIQSWHMCPEAGPIHASNPCSEYLFLDNSACNLASLNLAQFQNGDDLAWADLKQAARVLLLAQEILVDYAAYPTATIAENSHRFRPLGLGYANLGGLLMRWGIPYDSEAAAQWTSKITGTLHALALNTSVDLAEVHGAFAGWSQSKARVSEIVDRHADEWDRHPFAADELSWVTDLYRSVSARVARVGLRHAQVTLLAPTGTIGLLMDCDTLGIEPDFSLRKRKILVGGGEMRLANQAVGFGLARLGYLPHQVREILAHIAQQGTVMGAPGFHERHAAVFDCALAPQGFPERRISAMGHLRVMAAAQPFLSGAISKTVNLPTSATVTDVTQLYQQAWRMGLKALAIYRDGSKALQPLCAEC